VVSVEHEVIDNAQAQRFEVHLDGEIGVLEYRLRDGALWLIHTEVPHAIEGRGVAAALTRFALDDAWARGLHVVPRCDYVQAWLRRHPEYADVVREKGSEKGPE
jgi:predicted GNAT family acetyltransferase